MSHYHLEVILPPVENVEEAIEQILKPFKEEGEDEDGYPNPHPFWDFYVIGGRWAGAKLEASLDPEKLDAFQKELTERKVTVSGLRAGKPTLNPASQIGMVDDLWKEYFPDLTLTACPLFSHFNDQYKNSEGYPDVMRLEDLPSDLTASHVIIAAPTYKNDGTLEPEYMVQDSIWNGVSHVKSAWDGKVLSAIEEHKKRLEDYKPEFAAKATPQDNWLVVTVDYHS